MSSRTRRATVEDARSAILGVQLRVADVGGAVATFSCCSIAKGFFSITLLSMKQLLTDVGALTASRVRLPASTVPLTSAERFSTSSWYTPACIRSTRPRLLATSRRLPSVLRRYLRSWRGPPSTRWRRMHMCRLINTVSRAHLW